MTQTKIEPEAKKDFSRWLVVSDIDGTLNNKLRRSQIDNWRLILHFVCDLAGISLCLGAECHIAQKAF